MKIEPNLAHKLEMLKRLSEVGDKYERQVAKQKLELLLKKYGLDLESIDPEKTHLYRFQYRTLFERRLLGQIRYKVTNIGDGSYDKVIGKQVIILEMTKAQYVEVDYLYSFYRAELKKGFEKYYLAFIQANKLFGASNSNSRENEDLQDFKMEILNLARGITRTDPTKLLKS